MQRKYVYSLLALPILLVLALLAVMPGETRATFLTEFKHRTRLMMGYKPEKFSEEDGQYDALTNDSKPADKDAVTPSDSEPPKEDNGDTAEEEGEAATEVLSTNDADGHAEDEHEADETEEAAPEPVDSVEAK